jgi:MoaA/NifB/PqqE/SkfB family radical SAM enzyme
MRSGEAAGWKQSVSDSWLEKGKEVCRTLLEEAVEAIREAEEREGAETRVRLMESHCKELEDLTDKVEKRAVSETETEPLIKLAEEIEYRRDNVVNLAQMLKEDIPNEFKECVQRALQESAKMAKEGQPAYSQGAREGTPQACMTYS